MATGDKKATTFILSDDSINESGFRIDTEGIDISQFKENPIMLYMHNRANEWTAPQLLPIGIWNNVRKEGGKLLADAEFDMDDEFAVKIAKKVEKNHLRACSVGIKVLAISDDTKDLQKGQTRSTITKSRLLEVSIVDIPRNGNALKLAFGEDGDLMELGGVTVEKMNNLLPFIKSKLNMKTVLSSLNLKEDANEAEALAAVTSLKNSVAQLQTEKANLQAENQALKDQQTTERCNALVDKAIADKKITLADKENWLSLAKNNFESAEKALSSMKGYTSLADGIDSSKSDTTILSDHDKYEEMWKANKLMSWKKENKEEFDRCEKAYYQVVGEKHPRKTK